MCKRDKCARVFLFRVSRLSKFDFDIPRPGRIEGGGGGGELFKLLVYFSNDAATAGGGGGVAWRGEKEKTMGCLGRLLQPDGLNGIVLIVLAVNGEVPCASY